MTIAETEKRYPTEVKLLNCLLQSGEYQSLAAHGISSELFAGYDEEMSWVERFVLTHGGTPSRGAFLTEYPEFPWEKIKASELPHWAEKLKDEYKASALTRLLTNVSTQLYDNRVEQGVADELLNQLDSEIGEIKKVSGGTNAVFEVYKDYKTVYDIVVERATRSLSTPGGITGIPTGFPTLDMATGGLQPGWYTVVAGRLGTKKSWTAIKMAHAAQIAGKNVTYFSLEQHRTQIASRVYALESGLTNNGNVYAPRSLFTGAGIELIGFKEFLLRTSQRKDYGAFNIDDGSRGRVTAKSIAAVIQARQPDVVFVDYLTLMAPSSYRKDDGDWQSVGRISAELQEVAQRYMVPLVVMSQVNRGAGNEMPAPENLSRADAIGQDVDLMIGLRPAEPRSRRVVEYQVSKFRHAEGGQRWLADFNPDYGEFKEIGRPEADRILALEEELRIIEEGRAEELD